MAASYKSKNPDEVSAWERMQRMQMQQQMLNQWAKENNNGALAGYLGSILFQKYLNNRNPVEPNNHDYTFDDAPTTVEQYYAQNPDANPYYSGITPRSTVDYIQSLSNTPAINDIAIHQMTMDYLAPQPQSLPNAQNLNATILPEKNLSPMEEYWRKKYYGL